MKAKTKTVWNRVSAGFYRSKDGRFEIWSSLVDDGSTTRYAKNHEFAACNLGYMITAKAWCEERRTSVPIGV